MRYSTIVNILILIIILSFVLTQPLVLCAAQNQPHTNTMLDNFIKSFEERMVYCLFKFLNMALFLWTVELVWAVSQLYVRVGSWIIPIYDFTQASGNLGVGPEAVQGTKNLLVFIYGLAIIFIAFLTQLSLMRESLENRGPERSFINLGVAIAVLLFIQPIYSNTIWIIDSSAKHIYQTMQASLQNGQTNGFSDDLAKAIFSANILKESYYTSNSDKGQSLEQEPMASPDSVWTFWNDPTKGEQTLQNYFMNSPAAFFSKIIQLCLAIFGVIGIICLLVAKGFQIVAIWIFLPLGVLSCAFLANDSTKGVFYSWLKGFIGVCSWSFLWALLIYGLHVLAHAAQYMNGWSNNFALGSVLFPFVVFGAIWKLKNISHFYDSLAHTGHVAQAGFGELRGAIITAALLTKTGGMKLLMPTPARAAAAAGGTAAGGSANIVRSGLATSDRVSSQLKEAGHYSQPAAAAIKRPKPPQRMRPNIATRNSPPEPKPEISKTPQPKDGGKSGH